MATTSRERVRRELGELADRDPGVRDLALAAGRILERAVAFDGVCVVMLDPATLLPTGEVVDRGLPAAATRRMTEIEARGDDVNAFAALAANGFPAASLSRATGGDLDRSLRHRELRAPHGFGDELRAVLRADGVTWGALTLLRGSDRRSFTDSDTALVASVGRVLAGGLRRAILRDLASMPAGGDEGGVLVLAGDDSLAGADAAARRWLEALRDGGDAALPPVVRAVAARARSLAEGRGHAAARARARTASGRWVTVRGSVLADGQGSATAVTLEPARPDDLAPLVAAGYGLTSRERAVSQLVALGLSTEAIGRRLHLSPWTVQDHLKSAFAKAGVSTRGALVARLFFRQDAPRLGDGA